MRPQEKQIPTREEYLIIQNPQNGDYKINLIYFIIKLYENRWRFTGIFLFCLTSTLLFVFLQKPQFQVRTSVSMPIDNQYNHIFETNGYRAISQDIYDLFTSRLIEPSNIISFLKDTNLIESNFKETATKYSINNINNLSKKFIAKKLSQNKTELTTIFPNLNTSININQAYLNYTSQKTLKDISIEQNTKNLAIIKSRENSIKYFKELNGMKNKPKAYDFKIANLQRDLNYRKSLTFDTSNILAYKVDGSSVIEIITNTKNIMRLGLFLSIMLPFLWLIFQCNIIELRKKNTAAQNQSINAL